jgi:fumarate reductase subunit D
MALDIEPVLLPLLAAAYLRLFRRATDAFLVALVAIGAIFYGLTLFTNVGFIGAALGLLLVVLSLFEGAARMQKDEVDL